MIDKRIAVKAISWKLISTTIMFIMTRSLNISIIYLGLTLILYYFYDIAWNKFKFLKNFNSEKQSNYNKSEGTNSY